MTPAAIKIEMCCERKRHYWGFLKWFTEMSLANAKNATAMWDLVSGENHDY